MKFTGISIKGRGRARTLGFPTINLLLEQDIVVPEGIYAAKVAIQGDFYKAAMHCGASPTFSDAEKTIELYLVGLTEENIRKYDLVNHIGVTIEVETMRYLRPVITFSSKEALIAQIEQDVQQTISCITLPSPLILTEE